MIPWNSYWGYREYTWRVAIPPAAVRAIACGLHIPHAYQAYNWESDLGQKTPNTAANRTICRIPDQPIRQDVGFNRQ